MIRTTTEALALLRRAKVMTVVPCGEVKSLVSEVVGEPVRGSWWSHPKGNDIYRLLNALEDREDVLFTRLCDGKVTLVHRSLWPALLRAVTDEVWRERAQQRLSAADRRLLRHIEEQGEAPAKSAALPKTLLVHARQEHTDRGSHQSVLESWPHWMARNEIHAPHADLPTFEDAIAALRAACPGAKLPF